MQITTDTNKLIEDTEKSLRDGAYVVVGLGVLGFQRAQVRRRELAQRIQAEADSLSSQLEATAGRLGEQLSVVSDRVVGNLGTSRAQLTELAKSVDERVAPTRAQIDQQVDAFEERLPASARNVFSSFRSVVTTPESTLRSVVGLD